MTLFASLLIWICLTTAVGAQDLRATTESNLSAEHATVSYAASPIPASSALHSAERDDAVLEGDPWSQELSLSTSSTTDGTHAGANWPALPPPTTRRLAERPSWSGADAKLPGMARHAGILLSLFFGLTALQRLFLKRPRTALPAGMIEVCGKVPLDSKQCLRLVRIGHRLLVLLESPQGMQRLAEITDPLEVQQLLDPSGRASGEFASFSPKHLLSQFRHHEKPLA